MRLSELAPVLSGSMGNGTLAFDCPGHPGVRITVPFRHETAGPVDGVFHWHAGGSFPDTLTLTPSVNFDDGTAKWHGHVTNGEVTA